MPGPLRIKSDQLQMLSVLGLVQQGGAAYYRTLKNSSDLYLAVGAWCGLLDSKQVPFPMREELLGYCRFGAVRKRAFRHFIDMHDRDSAKRAFTTEAHTAGDLERAQMQAEFEFDEAAATEAAANFYLSTGDVAHLSTASEHAEATGGWRASLVWALRAVVIAPLNAVPPQRLLQVLANTGQPELLDEFAEVLTACKLHLQLVPIFRASAAMNRGNAQLCLTALKPLDDSKIAGNPTLVPYLGVIRALRAQAEEKLGHYQQAYQAYVTLNEGARAKDINPEDYYKGIQIRARLAVPPELPQGNHAEVVQMLGFPRSGTTLLENALNAHPLIDTFEEIPALTAAIDRIGRVLQGKLALEQPVDTFIAARTTYYEEVELRRHKPDAQVLVDKMPIRSGDADFISKLFPEWRYIFSIRHPFDVVLSCFKQRFQPNPAMENFRTIAGSVRLYDIVMTEWFKYHSLSDANVHYVRYDELVTDFDRVTHDVIDFLGVPWDDAVRDFSKASENRAVKTPSYQKVRQGLGIGVQTQWRNYGFIFQSEVAKPLHKWAEFFGYPTA